MPGALPADPFGLARDHGPCDACGTVELLAVGSLLCERCEGVSRAVAAAKHHAAEGVRP